MRSERLSRTGGLIVVLGAWLACSCAGTTPRPGGREDDARAPTVDSSSLVLVKGQPVAEVEAEGGCPSRRPSVAIEFQSKKALVTLRHQGSARFIPLAYELEDGTPVVYQEETVRSPLQQFLYTKTVQGRFSDVQEALSRLPNSERVALVEGLWDTTLGAIAHDPEGLALLARLYDALVSGSPGPDEARQAFRILQAVTQLHAVEEFAGAVLNPKTLVFPYRASGFTVLDSTPLSAHARPDGKIEVKVSNRVYRPDNVEGEPPLPGMRLELNPDTVVAIKLYDEGGKMVFVPALFLIEVSNEDTQRAKWKMLEAAGLGLGAGMSLGTSALVDTAVAPKLIPRVLAWCDAAAVGIGTFTSVLEEHRGWILSTFGDQGRRFLRRLDGLNNAIALYGAARVAMSAPRLVLAVRGAYRDFKAQAQAVKELTSEEAKTLGQLDGSLDDVLQNLEDIRQRSTGAELDSGALSREGADVIPLDSARRPDRPTQPQSQPTPLEEEEPVAATGTDGQLVLIRRQASSSSHDTTVASRQPGTGKGVEPRDSAPPSLRTSSPSPSRSKTRVQAEEEIARVLKLFPEQLELTPEEEAKLALAELEEVGDRMTGDLEKLWKERPLLENAPPGVTMEDRLWNDYIKYWYERYEKLEELAASSAKASAKPVEPPMRWEAYGPFRQRFAKALEFERSITAKMRAEASLPREQRQLVGNFYTPQIDANVGVTKGEEFGTFYPDQLVYETHPAPGQSPRFETFSVKQRNLKAMFEEEWRAQIAADVRYTLDHYGGVLEIRRPTHPFFKKRIRVSRVHLVYDARYIPEASGALDRAIKNAYSLGVEVHFQ